MTIRPFVFATIGLYVLSLVLTAATCAGGGTLPGWVFLVMGWLGLLALDPRWLGNLLFAGMVIYCLFSQPARRSLFAAMGMTIWPTAAMAIAILSSNVARVWVR